MLTFTKRDIVNDICRLVPLPDRAIYSLLVLRKEDFWALPASLWYKEVAPKIEPVKNLCVVCQNFPEPLERPKFGTCKSPETATVWEVIVKCDYFVRRVPKSFVKEVSKRHRQVVNT